MLSSQTAARRRPSCCGRAGEAGKTKNRTLADLSRWPAERCNLRLGGQLSRMPQNRAAHHRRFLDHAERYAYLHSFVADYNRTRLRCLAITVSEALRAASCGPATALEQFSVELNRCDNNN